MKLWCVFEEYFSWEGSWKTLHAIHLNEIDAITEQVKLEEENADHIKGNDADSGLYFSMEEWNAQ